MQRYLVFCGGLLVPIGLSVAGGWIVARFRLALPGPVLGLAIYITLLLLTSWLDWSLPAARWLAGWLGALIVPALVGVVLFAPLIATSGVRLGMVLVASTVITGVATAAIFRAVGGRG